MRIRRPARRRAPTGPVTRPGTSSLVRALAPTDTRELAVPARYMPHQPGTTFAEQVAAALDRALPLLARARAAGEPQPAASITVTDFTDDQLVIAKRVAAEKGTTVVWIDDRAVTRHGTVAPGALDAGSRQVLRSGQVSRAAGDKLHR